MLHAGLDLSRRKLDVHLLDEQGTTIAMLALSPDGDALGHLAAEVAQYGQPVSAVIESMNGARFVHDVLERAGWSVEVADARKVKGLAPCRARPTASTRGCWPSCRAATSCRRSGCPIPASARPGSAPASGCIWCVPAPG